MLLTKGRGNKKISLSSIKSRDQIQYDYWQDNIVVNDSA